MGMYFADVHCHILPCVDDGASSMQEAVAMLQMEYRQGVGTVLLTPHYRRGYFETSRQTVREQFARLCRIMAQDIPDMQLYLGCELYRQNEMGRLLESDSSYCIAGTKYVLIEFMPGDLADTIWRCVGELLIDGYRPVIAHAERYRALRDVKFIRRLVDSGVYIQMNAGSILGECGWSTKHFCSRLLKEGYVHLIGSDAHHTDRRMPCIGPCAEYLRKKLGEREMERLLTENPRAMLAGEYI